MSADFLSLMAAIATGFLVLIFARALFHKATAYAEFRATLAEYRLLPERVGDVAAIALVIAEAVILIGLLVPVASQTAHWGAAALLGLYAVAMAINLLRGRDRIDCGCGGSGQSLSWGLIGRNAVLLVAAVLAAPVSISLDGGEAAVAVAAIASLWVLLILFEQLLGNHTHARLTGQA